MRLIVTGYGSFRSSVGETIHIIKGPEVKMKRQSRIKVEVLRDSGYGKVPGLDDDELADDGELLRQVMIEQWAPFFDIPMQQAACFIKPTLDDNGHLDWGAFGTVDFEKLFPVNKNLYKRDRLREQLRHTLIMFDMIKEKVPEDKRAEVIKYVYSGKDIDLIDDWYQWRMASWFSRARRLRDRIRSCCRRSFGPRGA